MQNGGFATFFETGGAGGNHYLHCRITCGPKPDGATEAQVVSCGADGFHSTETTRGPDIEDCDFEGVYHDDYWGEANYCWNVIVSNNVIRNCVKRNGDDGTILVHGDGAVGNRHIVIRDNLFDADYGQAIMKLEWTDGLEITGNRIISAFELPLKQPGHVIALAHDRNVKIAGNKVEHSGSNAGSTIGTGEDVSGVVNSEAIGPGKKE